MKGYELIQRIANGEIKENTKIKVSFNTTLIDIVEYKNKKINWKQNGNFNTEYLCSNTVEFKLIEENKEIEELDTNILNGLDGFTLTAIEEVLTDKINELARAVNKLIKESEEN